MDNRKTLTLSIILSVLLHGLLLVLSSNIVIPGFKTKAERRTRLFRIKTIKKEIPRQVIQEKRIVSSKPLKFESPHYGEDAARAIEREERKIKKEEMIKPEEEPAEPLEKALLEESEPLTPPVEMDVSAVGDAALRVTRKDLFDDQDVPSEAVLVSPDDFFERGQVPRDFYEKMPGFTPSISKEAAPRLAADKPEPARRMETKYSPAIKAKKRASRLDEALVFELSKYVDPQDHYKYFKIEIKVAQGSENFKALPKEIMFLIDCSFSIKEKRFEQFQEGIKYALSNLNEGDAFNVIAFKTRLIKFWPFPIEATPDITWKALKFVENLTVGEKTDTYQALYESIQKEKHRRFPAYIILLSDGRPTAGITDSRRIISEITKINQGRISIFGLTGGVFVNRYLLDFISYNNRGWTEYAKRTHFIADELSRLYDKIRDPILTNVRFHVSGLDDTNIFPKLLPDFFRKATFTLYGRYREEDNFTLEVLADAGDGTHEYLVDGSLSTAIEGDESIAREWAFNKIYYLISLLDETGDMEPAIAEIRSLYQKFDIRTPYLKKIRK